MSQRSHVLGVLAPPSSTVQINYVTKVSAFNVLFSICRNCDMCVNLLQRLSLGEILLSQGVLAVFLIYSGIISKILRKCWDLL